MQLEHCLEGNLKLWIYVSEKKKGLKSLTYGFTLRSQRKKSERKGSLTFPILTRRGWNSSGVSLELGEDGPCLKTPQIVLGVHLFLNFLAPHTYHDSHWQSRDLGDRRIFHCHLLFPVPSPIREAHEGAFLEFHLSPAWLNQETPNLSPPSEWGTLCPYSFIHWDTHWTPTIRERILFSKVLGFYDLALVEIRFRNL